MKKVRIFIKTTLRNPQVKAGSYAAVVECITSKGPVTREIAGSEDSTTYNRLVLLAIVEALMILREVCQIKLHTDNGFVASTINQNRTELWKREEWKKPSGENVKNMELWQQYAYLSEGHEIDVINSKINVYDNRLNKILAEEERKYTEKLNKGA